MLVTTALSFFRKSFQSRSLKQIKVVNNEHANVSRWQRIYFLNFRVSTTDCDCVVIAVRDITDWRGGLNYFLLEVCKASDEFHWQGEGMSLISFIVFRKKKTA